MRWPDRKLGDLVTLQRGHDLPEYRRQLGPVPVIGSAGPNGFHNEVKQRGPGVTVGRSGASIGNVTYINQDYWPHNTCLYVTDFKGNYPRFVAYLLSTLNLGQLNSGAAQPSLNRNFVYRLHIRFPEPAKQERIADILSAYDDLIENNRRRIVLLERVARELYREWFVRLRFPGHEHVKVINGVPEGWTTKALGEIANITMGQSPKSTFYNEDGNGLPFHQGVTNFGNRFPSYKTYCTVENRVAEVGDILFSVRAPVGRINVTRDKVVIGRGVAAIRSNRNQQNLLFYALKSHFFKEDMVGVGAIFAAITKKDLYGVDLTQASDQVAEMFMDCVQPLDSQIKGLHRMVECLTQARDLLLPRLMSGEVAV